MVDLRILTSLFGLAPEPEGEPPEPEAQGIEAWIDVPDEFFLRYRVNQGESPEAVLADIKKDRKQHDRPFQLEITPLAEIFEEAKQAFGADWKRMAKEVLSREGLAAIGHLFGETARFSKIAAVGGEFDADDFKILSNLAIHMTGMIDIATPEGRIVLKEYIAKRPADFSADLLALGSMGAGAVAKAIPALKFATFAANHPKLAGTARIGMTGGKIAMDPGELLGVGVDVGLGAAKKGVGALADAQTRQKQSGMSFEEGDLRYPTELDADGNVIATQRAPGFVTSQNPGTQKTAAALYKLSPGGFVKRETQKLYAGLQKAGESILAQSTKTSDIKATLAPQLDELNKALAQATTIGDDARPQIEILVGRSLKDAEFNEIMAGTAGPAMLTTIVDDMIGNKMKEIANPTSWQAGRNIADSFDKFKTDLNSEIGKAYTDAMSGISDKSAQYAKTIAYIDSILDGASQGRKVASTDIAALEQLKVALEADNANANFTIGEMDKTRTEYRMSANPVLTPGRIDLSEARKRGVYRAISEDMYDAINVVDPKKGAALLAAKTKDALYHRLLEKKFAETITDKAEKGEYSGIANDILSKKHFADPQMYADMKKALGGDEGAGWLSLKSYYLENLLESAQTAKSTNDKARFSLTGLNNALKKNKESYRIMLGDDVANQLEQMGERLIGMEEFITSIEGSQTAFNESIIQGLMSTGGDVTRAGKLPGLAVAVTTLADALADVVMGQTPDMMWNWQGRLINVGVATMTLIGQDAYMSLRGTGKIGDMPASVLPDAAIVNDVIAKGRKVWDDSLRKPAPRVAHVGYIGYKESQRDSELPGQLPPQR